MTLQEIYDRYQIMPNLQRHQCEVAGVADIISQHHLQVGNPQDVLWACLLHDMGNIIKFDLTRFPEALLPQGYEYWLAVQRDFIQRYGRDEHQATITIVQELGVAQRVVELISAVGFEQAWENVRSLDIERKICCYADVRVSPVGVVSLTERCADLEKRYGAKYPSAADQRRRIEFQQIMQKIEEDIFQHCDITAQSLAPESVRQFVQQYPQLVFPE